jgi:serine/threonine-protein kinase
LVEPVETMPPTCQDGAVPDTRSRPPTAADVVAGLGRVFAVFDERTQDSGHVSYGVEAAGGRRWFVKTAGGPAPTPAGVSRAQRADALRRAARVQRAVGRHPALVDLHEVVETSDGVAVVHDWFDGELLRSPAARRDDPTEAGNRFRRLPLPEVIAALDQVIDLHVRLEAAGWVAGDFYDGCLMYDFAAGRMKVMDLECYRHGAYVNEQGRLPGSTRFMAPEELRLGATVDFRTTVYNLGRMVELFLLAEHGAPQVRSLVAAATAAAPGDRPDTVAELHARWRSVTG